MGARINIAAMYRCTNTVYTCILLFVAVSPVPQGGVRPLVVLSYRYRLPGCRIIELFSNDNIETFDTISKTKTWMHAAERSLVLFKLKIVTTLLIKNSSSDDRPSISI